MLNPKFKNLFDQEMTRKEFLRLGALTVASLVGVVGVISELLSHAATPYASGEAEGGTLLGGAQPLHDSAASGGEAVEFGVLSTSGLPTAPMGPTAPAAGYRLLLADDFVGTTLDTNLWTPSRGIDGSNGPQDAPFNSWETANLVWANTTVNGSYAVMKNTYTGAVEGGDGVTRYYGGACLNTAGGQLSNTQGFRFSPAFAGPLYVQIKCKFAGDAANSNNSAYGGLWCSSVRKWGMDEDGGGWTEEQDWYEMASQANNHPDSNVFALPNGYGTSGNPQAGGSKYGSSQPNIAPTNASGSFDAAADFHLWTVRLNIDGSFDQWIDGTYFRNAPANNVASFGSPKVNQSGSAAEYSSFSVAYDYMSLIIQADMKEIPNSGWAGDKMLVDYVVVWQDASVPEGQGIVGGGIATGTVI